MNATTGERSDSRASDVSMPGATYQTETSSPYDQRLKTVTGDSFNDSQDFKKLLLNAQYQSPFQERMTVQQSAGQNESTSSPFTNLQPLTLAVDRTFCEWLCCRKSSFAKQTTHPAPSYTDPENSDFRQLTLKKSSCCDCL